MSQCWAYGTYGRCDKDGGHDDEHQITFTWSDADVLNPSVPVPLVGLPSFDDQRTHDSVLVDQAVGHLGPCFSCGCTAPQHDEIGPDGEAMCAPHQCRQFIA